MFEGDTHEHCGVMYDDMYRLAVCPHYLLAGGDAVGIGPKRTLPSEYDAKKEPT